MALRVICSDLIRLSVVVAKPRGQTVVFDQRIQGLGFLHEQPELPEKRQREQLMRGQLSHCA